MFTFGNSTTWTSATLNTGSDDGTTSGVREPRRPTPSSDNGSAKLEPPRVNDPAPAYFRIA